jgi:hypothetical protein
MSRTTSKTESAPPSDAEVIRAIRAQASKLAAKRKPRTSPVFPSDLTLPPGRKVFVQVISRRISDYASKMGYKVGELLRPDTIWLDAPPHNPDSEKPGWGERAVVGQSAFASGTTDLVRVQ